MTVTRRTFLHQASLLAGGLALTPLWRCTTARQQEIGLQLYTLRDTITTNLQGVLHEVASIGYTALESYGYADRKIFGVPFGDFISMTNDLGMRVISGHYGSGFQSTAIGTLRNQWEVAVEDAAAAGQEYMVVAWLEPAERATIDDYKKLAELINSRGEICRKAGVKLAYHNHSYEFDTLEGQVPYHVLLEELDPAYVRMELDLYWVVRAEYDPLQYFEKYPKRFSLWHVKDMDKTDRNRNADVGTGTLDFPAIFAHAAQSGMEHFFIEQENYAQSPVESIQHGFDYIKTLA